VVERVMREANEWDSARLLDANATTQHATEWQKKTEKTNHGRVGSHAYAANLGAHGKAAPKPILTW